MARPSPDEIKDMRDQQKLEDAYNKSMRLTAPAPKAPASAASAPKKMAKGGVTRADGCVTKGHTKGRVV